MKKNHIRIIGIAIVAMMLLNACQPKLSEQEKVQQALGVIGLEYTQAEIDTMMGDVESNRSDYQQIRSIKLDNSVPPAVMFNPLPVGFEINKNQQAIQWNIPTDVKLPENRDEIAFYSIMELASLIKSGQLSSVELTKLYIERIKTHDSLLNSVITLTEELALEQAIQADVEIAAGNYRGPLHGIPYGTKDLLALEGYKTTWGSNAHKEQMLNQTATVIKKLENAGAVHIAKLSLGALAWGDVWYGATTKNPWNLEQGSSGSSAGPASATVAGLVGFSIGSETWGSIVSPSTRCGASGLRPSYGRVSRTGAMALSWSMDKLGPICRTIEDCAIVFEAISGSDSQDISLMDAAYNYNPNKKLKNIRIGYFANYFESASENDKQVLNTFRELGVELIEVAMPDSLPVNALGIILSAEAGAAFQNMTLENTDDMLVRQVSNAWPNVFRHAQLIPAVEYINANRMRTLIIQQMHELFQEVDVVITPSYAGTQLLTTNLTGHPCAVVPNGFNDSGSPTSISFIGQLFNEADVLTVAKAYQLKAGWHKQHPTLFLNE